MNKVKESAKIQDAKTVKNEGVQIAKIDKKILQESVKAEKIRQKIEFENQAKKILGSKFVGEKEIFPSASTVKIQATIERLYDKENRSLTETKFLVNALSKMERLNASQLYKYMAQKNELVPFFLELCGKKELPTFKEFANSLPVKFIFSEYDVLGALSKMNPKHALNLKIARQNKAVNAK